MAKSIPMNMPSLPWVRVRVRVRVYINHAKVLCYTYSKQSSPYKLNHVQEDHMPRVGRFLLIHHLQFVPFVCPSPPSRVRVRV